MCIQLLSIIGSKNRFFPLGQFPINFAATSFKVNSGQIYLQRIISCLYSPEQSFPTLPW